MSIWKKRHTCNQFLTMLTDNFYIWYTGTLNLGILSIWFKMSISNLQMTEIINNQRDDISNITPWMTLWHRYYHYIYNTWRGPWGTTGLAFTGCTNISVTLLLGCHFVSFRTKITWNPAFIVSIPTQILIFRQLVKKWHSDQKLQLHNRFVTFDPSMCTTLIEP